MNSSWIGSGGDSKNKVSSVNNSRDEYSNVEREKDKDNYLKMTNGRFLEIENKILKLEGKNQNLEKSMGDLLKDNVVQIVSVMGIFVAFFTFISTSFKLFESVDNFYTASGFLCIFGSLLLFFVGFIAKFVGKEINFFGYCLFMMIIGCVLLGFGIVDKEKRFDEGKLIDCFESSCNKFLKISY